LGVFGKPGVYPAHGGKREWGKTMTVRWMVTWGGQKKKTLVSGGSNSLSGKMGLKP